MAAVFLATIAGSAGASAASGSISEAQKRKTQLENDLNDAQALIEQLQDQEGDIQEAVRELDDRLNVISGNIDTLKAQTRKIKNCWIHKISWRQPEQMNPSSMKA